MHDLWYRYLRGIKYLITGLLTTAVNMFAFELFVLIWGVDTPTLVYLAVIFRFSISVTFAFFMNRIWVFGSKDSHPWVQFIYFVSGRIGTLCLDMVIMRVLPSYFGVGLWTATIISNILVIILNYVFSRFLVFSESTSQKRES